MPFRRSGELPSAASSRRPWLIRILTGCAIALAAGGIAVAAVPSAGHVGVIRACYQQRTGVLRLLKARRCHRSERAISWNQQGIPGLSGGSGPSGAPGAAGSQGAQGEPGPTASAFSSFEPGEPVAIEPAGVSVAVMSLTDGNGTPITTTFNGRILINAAIRLFPTTASAERMFCHLEIARTGGAFVSMSQEASVLMTDTVELPLVGGANEPSGTYNVRIVCLRNGPNAVDFIRGDMTAMAAAG